VFFYLSKLLFSGFFQFKGDFVRGQNNGKYRDFKNKACTKIIVDKAVLSIKSELVSKLYLL